LAAEGGGDLALKFLFAAVEGGEVRGVEEEGFGEGAFLEAGGGGVAVAVLGEEVESAAIGGGVVGFGVGRERKSTIRIKSRIRIRRRRENCDGFGEGHF
jgi:hypothetical protein